MNSFAQILAFGAGSLCLGVFLVFGVLSFFLSRNSRFDGASCCLSKFIAFSFFSVAAFFFIVAVNV